jgi:hypothetical protein
MDPADIAIEGAGLVLVGTIFTGIIAVLYARRRLLLGIAIGMTLAVVTLPFVAYVVAYLTHHRATDVDVRPPAYIVATAISCSALSVLGLIWGAFSEVRHRHDPPHDFTKQSDELYRDDPSQWLPWRARRRRNDAPLDSQSQPPPA